MSTYRTAKSKWNQTHSGNDPYPVDRDDFEANIPYTPLADQWTVLSPTDRARIRQQLIADTAAVHVIAKIVRKPSLLTTSSPQGVADKLAAYLDVHNRTLSLLDEFGAEPAVETDPDAPPRARGQDTHTRQ